MNRPPETSEFAARLLAWFDDSGRHDLPWQQQPTPYRVWVSEIMLQQTQVKTVIPYFERFVGRFPDVARLAGAGIDEVLHLWSGLGYYARGRNLHRAAQAIMEEHSGIFPNDLESLIALPGIGRSTAGAILALAFHQRQPILDGNVKRVLARQFCVDGPVNETAVQNVLWQFAETLTPMDRVAAYTQAIMDLGATVCTRRDPGCGDCPVADSCLAFARQAQAEFPTRKSKKVLPIKRTRMLLVCNNESQVFLERRPPAGIWGGLWCLPELSLDESPHDWCRHRGLRADSEFTALPRLNHSFTHFKLDIEPLAMRVVKKASMILDQDSWLWYNVRDPQPVGLAKPTTTLLRRLEDET